MSTTQATRNNLDRRFKREILEMAQEAEFSRPDHIQAIDGFTYLCSSIHFAKIARSLKVRDLDEITDGKRATSLKRLVAEGYICKSEGGQHLFYSTTLVKVKGASNDPADESSDAKSDVDEAVLAARYKAQRLSMLIEKEIDALVEKKKFYDFIFANPETFREFAFPPEEEEEAAEKED